MHNEFLRGNFINPEFQWKGHIKNVGADLIILAGDIDVGTKGMQWAIEESVRLSTPIIYVSGNHEYYHHEMNYLKRELRSLTKNTNVTFLDPGVYVSNDVRIIGATLWTDYKVFRSASRSKNMFQVGNALRDHIAITIKDESNKASHNFTPDDALSLHVDELNFILNELNKPYKGKTIVVTHHGPHPACQHTSFLLGPISSGFQSDLSHIIDRYSIDAWVYGHTHCNLDTKVGDTRIISNQAGYPNENVQDFRPDLLIEV